MAEILRENGDAAAMEQIGRDLEWIELAGSTTDFTVAGELELITNVLMQYCSITIIGEPTATAVVFGVEGLGATTAELDTAIEAALTAGTVVVTTPALTGNAFV